MLRYMLDTHIVSHYLRRASPALEALVNAGLRERTIAISSIARAELRYGQMGLPPQDRRRPLIDSFLSRLPSASGETGWQSGFQPSICMRRLTRRFAPT